VTQTIFKFPVIHTDRLILRNFLAADLASVYEIFSHPAVTEFYDLATFTHRDQAAKLVNANIASNQECGARAFRWAICLRSEPNTMIGSCGFHTVNKSFFSFEIGYELNHTYWRKQFAYEAVQAMIDFCFRNNFPFPVNRISATTNLESDRSIRLLSKLGFKEEGVLRQYGFWKNQFHDLRLFSVLRKEWHALSG
jgi:[ribosomal protein S5]-alanine N-acetyltransferase